MKYNASGLVLFGTFLLPLSALAADFVPLVGIPGLTGDATTQGFGDYINAVYRLMISIGALMAVVKIVGAGAKYMLSDIVTSKSQAIKDIRGAIFGLLIVIGAVVILNTINASIVNTSLTFTKVETTGPPPETLPEVTTGDILECANLKTEEERDNFDLACRLQDNREINIIPNADAGCTGDYQCISAEMASCKRGDTSNEFCCNLTGGVFTDKCNIGDTITIPDEPSDSTCTAAGFLYDEISNTCRERTPKICYAVPTGDDYDEDPVYACTQMSAADSYTYDSSLNGCCRMNTASF